MGRFIRNGERGESINIRFYVNYIAAKEISAFCKQVAATQQRDQIDYKSFVTKVSFWPLCSFVGGYIGQVNRAG